MSEEVVNPIGHFTNRPPPGRVAGTDPTNWKSVHQRYYEGHMAFNVVDNLAIDSTILYGTNQAGIINNLGPTIQSVENVSIKNSLFLPYKDIYNELPSLNVPPQNEGTLWLNRCYVVNNWTIYNSGFYNSGWHIDAARQEGHGTYYNLYGGVSYDHCEFINNKGQAIQLVNRPWENPQPSPAGANGKIAITNSLFRENGNPIADRAGYCISIFGTGTNQDVHIDNCHIENLHYNGFLKDGIMYHSIAGILVYPGDSWWGNNPVPFTQGNVLIENCYIKMNANYGELLKAKACKSLTIRNCHFESIGQTRGVDIDPLNTLGPNCGAITLQGNSGNSTLRIRGVNYPITANINM